MNKNDITLCLAAAAFLCAGFSVGNTIKCCDKTAVVDVVAVVGKSSEVQDLRHEVVIKRQELSEWLQNVQKEVKSEKNKKKKDALLEQYNAEFAQKRELISKEYNEKLQEIDKSIKETIIKTAQKKGYKTVISKSVVIYGGTDITEEVMKVVE